MGAALEGLKILEIGQILAGPFAASLLGDFGAEVIKVEPPRVGDIIRGMGRIKDLWFAVEGRNKKCITLNLKLEKGRELFYKLLEDADVLIENFKPGVFNKMGYSWEVLHKMYPRLIMVSASGYGQTGPYSPKPGFDRIGLAMGGLLHVTGFPDGPPIKPGLSVGDFMTGMLGAVGILTAVYNRDIVGTGEGQWVDVCLTETTLRIMESIIVEYSYDGFIRNRVGNGTYVTIPSGHFMTKDNKYLVLSVGGDKVFAAFAKAIGREELLESEEYNTAAGRSRNRDEINGIAEEWAKNHTVEECINALGDEVPCCKVYTAEDIVKDPQFAYRNDIVKVQTRKFGEISMQGVTPKLSGTPGEIRWAGAELGAYNEKIFLEKLKLDREDFEQLQREGVI